MIAPNNPEIHTERLNLRQAKESDWQEIFFLRSNKQVNEFIHRPENRQTKTKEDAIDFIKKINKGIENKDWNYWGISLKEHPQIIGTITLWNFSEDKKTAEIGYDMNPTFQRNGFMNEAMKHILDFGFNQLALDKIEAFTHKENLSSKKLLEKNGFILNETRKDEDNSYNIVFEIEKPAIK